MKFTDELQSVTIAAVAATFILSSLTAQAQRLIWEVPQSSGHHARGQAAHQTGRSGQHVESIRGERVRRAGLVRAPYSHAVNYSVGSGSYLNQTEGESRWPDGHVIRVYVAPGRPTFPSLVDNSFNEWTRATGGRIRFTMVHDPGSADYLIGWTGRQREVSEGTEAGLTTTDTVVDEDSGREFIERANTNILTKFNGRSLSDKEIGETCLHEIGHGLGIEGHSSNSSDIMYYAVSNRQSGHLTNRDANTISQLYAY